MPFEGENEAFFVSVIVHPLSALKQNNYECSKQGLNVKQWGTVVPRRYFPIASTFLP